MTERSPTRTPWGFRIVVGLALAYLLLRFVEIGAWVIDWLA